MTDVYPMDHVKVKIIIKKILSNVNDMSYFQRARKRIFISQNKFLGLSTHLYLMSHQSILNLRSKPLQLPPSHTRLNRSKHLINLDLSIVLICSHIIIESCSRSSRLLIKTCVGKFSFFPT